jgi:hypothetical protein
MENCFNMTFVFKKYFTTSLIIYVKVQKYATW